MVENAGADWRVKDAGVENAGATKYGKPSEENTLKYQTKYDCRGFHAYLLPNATHNRVSKQVGTSKQCIVTHNAVSHAVGSEKMLSESHSDADDDDNTEAPDDTTQHQNNDETSDDAGTPTTVSADAAVDFCELCIVAPSDTHIALAPCGHQRFYESCMPTKCTTKDAAVLFAARLSTCCCVCTNLTYA